MGVKEDEEEVYKGGEGLHFSALSPRHGLAVRPHVHRAECSGHHVWRLRLNVRIRRADHSHILGQVALTGNSAMLSSRTTRLHERTFSVPLTRPTRRLGRWPLLVAAVAIAALALVPPMA